MKWAERKNHTGIAHLARGVYHWHLGWMTRGTRFINKTPQERINGMKTYFNPGEERPQGGHSNQTKCCDRLCIFDKYRHGSRKS